MLSSFIVFNIMKKIHQGDLRFTKTKAGKWRGMTDGSHSEATYLHRSEEWEVFTLGLSLTCGLIQLCHISFSVTYFSGLFSLVFSKRWHLESKATKASLFVDSGFLQCSAKSKCINL